jgi:hypothetical protein
VDGPDGRLYDVLRFHSAPLWDRAALIALSADGRVLSFDARSGFVELPGGMSKFTIRRDGQTGLYFTLSNGSPDPGPHANRSVLSLYASADLRSWRHMGVLLRDDLSASPEEAGRRTGFQYADWQFDGDDIVALVRSAYDGAPNFHDANRITFHRIGQFRSLPLSLAKEQRSHSLSSTSNP